MVIYDVGIAILFEFDLLTETLLRGFYNHSIGTSGANIVMNGNRFITRPLLLIRI